MFSAGEVLEKVRKEKPLVHHITNWVTIYDCANVVRTIGALPVMAHAIRESPEMQSLSSSLVLNIGTQTSELVESMIEAAKAANRLNHPVVLDAVGVGATDLRTKKAKEILNSVKVDVLKGNKSEIAKLAGADVFTRGVEAMDVEENLSELAENLADEWNNTVVITGAHDIIATKNKSYVVKNGHEMLGKFVGTGCMVTSVIGCFVAVEPDYAKASASALAYFGVAAELAIEKKKTPAAFKQQFFDELYELEANELNEMQEIEELE
jgi:hydroxyethylthiazole kinase